MAGRYIELAIGDFSNRGMVRKLEELPSYIIKAQEANLPLYRSYYSFDEDYVEYCKANRSAKSFDGRHHLDRIILDIDKGKDTDADTLSRARAFADKLQHNFTVPKKDIHVFYSGTGYHVELPDLFGFESTSKTSRVVKNTLQTVFPEGDNIYDTLRLIRVEGTVNQKSGCFKVPLSLEELYSLSADQIKELAAHARTDFRYNGFETVDHPLKGLIKPPLQATESPVYKTNTGQIATCMQTVYNKGESGMTGARHTAVMSMTSAYRRGGLPEEAALTLMKAWAPRLEEEEPGEVERTVRKIYKQGMQYSCSADLFAKHCDPKCMFFAKKDFGLGVANSEEMEEQYIRFMATDFSKSAFDLRELYNLKNPYMFYPGELCLVLGDTKIGKTTLVQNWCVALKRMRVLYLSLEVAQHLLFRKFIQIAHGLPKDTVLQKFKSAEAGLHDAISHIFVSTLPPSLSALERTIADVAPQLVVVDTTDCIKLDRLMGLDKEDAQGRGLKELAQKLNVIIIGIHHIAKPDKFNPHGPLTVHSGKGSSTWEQKADKVISIEGNPEFNVRTIKSLAARDEAAFRVTANIDWNTFTIRQAT